MPDNPKWTEMKAKLADAINRIGRLESELKQVKQILAEIAEDDPGGAANITGGG